MFENIMHEFLGVCLYLLNFFMPKNRKKAVIISFPDFDDQTRAILQSSDDKSVVILTDNVKAVVPSWVPENIKIVNRKSVKGVYNLLTASLVFYTHGVFSFFKLLSPERQLVVNITHGMYIKNMHLLDGQDSAPQSHYILCTSLLFKKVLSKTFGVKEEQVLIKGLPRNKILLQSSLNNDICSLRKRYSHIHVWLPTYRKSCIGDVRLDVESDSVFGSNELDLEKLNNILESKNDILLIKPHPMAQCSLPEIEYSNIMFITNVWLESKDITLYELLSASSSLWTDYSSVFVDYMVTKKPILFVVFDIELYKGNRGLTIDLEGMNLPGEIVKNINGFYEGVENVMSQQSYDLSPFIEKGVCEDVCNIN